jgi:hypothetical protein
MADLLDLMGGADGDDGRTSGDQLPAPIRLCARSLKGDEDVVCIKFSGKVCKVCGVPLINIKLANCALHSRSVANLTAM